MRTTTPLSFAALLVSLLLIGCDRKTEPPIQLEAVAPAVTEQLTDRFGDRFVKVGKVQFEASKGLYLVEVFYKHQDQEKRYVLDFIRTADDRNLLMYQAGFPLDLVGEGSPQGRVTFPVTIDEMMNE